VANTDQMICSQCKVEMSHHCDKVVCSAGTDEAGNDPVLGGTIAEYHTCPKCGGGALRHA
jgi:ribosomal protein S27AE